MKTTIQYSTLIIASLLLANCGGGGSTTPTPDQNETNETTPTTPETKELTVSPLAPEVTINEGELYTVPTLTISGDGPFATTYHTLNDYGKIAVEAGQQFAPDQNTTLTATATELGGNHQTLTVEQKIIFVPADAPDADNDGTPDATDAFPNDPDETADTDADTLGDNADQCDDTVQGATIDANGCEITPDIPTNFDVNYTTDIDLGNGNPIVIPTGNISSTDQMIEYIVVNGIRLDVNETNYTFSGSIGFEGTTLIIDVKLEGKDELEKFSS